MLTFTSRPSCTQVIDAFGGRVLARPAVVVYEVTDISSAAAAGGPAVLCKPRACMARVQAVCAARFGSGAASLPERCVPIAA